MQHQPQWKIPELKFSGSNKTNKNQQTKQTKRKPIMSRRFSQFINRIEHFSPSPSSLPGARILVNHQFTSNTPTITEQQQQQQQCELRVLEEDKMRARDSSVATTIIHEEEEEEVDDDNDRISITSITTTDSEMDFYSSPYGYITYQQQQQQEEEEIVDSLDVFDLDRDFDDSTLLLLSSNHDLSAAESFEDNIQTTTDNNSIYKEVEVDDKDDLNEELRIKMNQTFVKAVCKAATAIYGDQLCRERLLQLATPIAHECEEQILSLKQQYSDQRREKKEKEKNQWSSLSSSSFSSIDLNEIKSDKLSSSQRIEFSGEGKTSSFDHQPTTTTTRTTTDDASLITDKKSDMWSTLKLFVVKMRRAITSWFVPLSPKATTTTTTTTTTITASQVQSVVVSQKKNKTITQQYTLNEAIPIIGMTLVLGWLCSKLIIGRHAPDLLHDFEVMLGRSLHSMETRKHIIGW